MRQAVLESQPCAAKELVDLAKSDTIAFPSRAWRQSPSTDIGCYDHVLGSISAGIWRGPMLS